MPCDQTPTGIAKRFNVTAKTARRWAAEDCPHVRRAGRIYFDADDVADWLESQRRSGLPGRPKTPESANAEAARQEKDLWLMRKYRAQALDLESGLIAATAHRAELRRVHRLYREGFAPVAAYVGCDAANVNRAEVERITDAGIRETLDTIADRLGDDTDLETEN